ncbi:putative Tic20 family protein [Xanthomonas sacchari]|uniref:DUF4870 domain-containing protein n=1 Tax=Xanthomonas sacchari TaxID=56458 RepID=UPI002789745E|nr:DUF4870 domain-containing protein [Xanthomonas sacchari]MDQ1093936.1 putative Tic20 family protein [Xanthomonas sacchari]
MLPAQPDSATSAGHAPVPARERALAALAHVSMWIGFLLAVNVHLVYALWWLLGLWLPPGAQWLAMRRGRPFAAEHARQAMLLGIGLSVLSALLLAPCLLIFGAALLFAPLLILMLLVAMCLTLGAAARAMHGRRYRYPLPYGAGR